MGGESTRYQQELQSNDLHDKTSLDQSDDPPNMIEALLRFMYYGRYKVPKHVGQRLRPGFHLQVYKLADKYEVSRLMDLALEKFEACYATYRGLDDVLFASDIAYSIYCEPSPPYALRAAAVKIADKRRDTLFGTTRCVAFDRLLRNKAFIVDFLTIKY